MFGIHTRYHWARAPSHTVCADPTRTYQRCTSNALPAECAADTQGSEADSAPPQVFLYLFLANNLFITSTLIVGAGSVISTLCGISRAGLCLKAPIVETSGPPERARFLARRRDEQKL